MHAPDVLDLVDPLALTELADEMAEALTRGEAAQEIEAIVPTWRTLDASDLLDTLRPMVHATLQDAAAGSSLGTDLSFTHSSGGHLYAFLAARLTRTGGAEAELLSHARLLHELTLPAVDDIADEDFVAIRLQSEDFEEYRDVLARSLMRTEAAVRDGAELDRAFADNLDEVRWRAELLRRDLRDKPLRKYLRESTQGVAIGSLVSTAATAAGAPPASVQDLQSLAAQFGVSTVLGTLFALVVRAPTIETERLLRFYDVLLDDSSEPPG